MDKRPALGRGLSALIPEAPEPRQAPVEVDIDRLMPNSLQPRGQVEGADLDALAASIKVAGVIQPLVVRRVGDRYQIIAGERRWRAAQRAGLLRVPVVVREVPEGQEQSLLEMALIENLQREDLNPIEEAQAYRRLCDQFGLTQDTVASRVGKDRATVANVLRLLKLPDEVRQEVAAGTLSMGHARALLGLANEADQRNMARDVVARSLSVRETETLVKRASDASRTADPAQRRTVDLHTRAAEERLRMRLGTRVRIVRQGTRGRIEIDFASETELIRLFEAIVGEARESRGMDGHVVG